MYHVYTASGVARYNGYAIEFDSKRDAYAYANRIGGSVKPAKPTKPELH